MRPEDPAVVLAIDAGTTSGRVIAFDRRLQMVAQAARPLKRSHPQSDWVEQNPDDIWQTIRDSLADVVAALNGRPIAAIGITNQRETTMVWDRRTGQPVYPAIVWQCRRTTAICRRYQDHAAMVRSLTGLPVDPYFSATKVRWLLDEVDGVADRMKRGELAFGTVDTWLLWQLTGGQVHATDPSNASRTMLYGLRSGGWEPELLELFGVDASAMPAILPSAGPFGSVAAGLPAAGTPITGVLGDQQAALFGQCGWQPGVSKNTYGTGLFLMTATGAKLPDAGNLVSTVAWEIDGRRTFALEGSVFIGGALLQWLRDGLGLLQHVADSAALAASVPDSGGVVFVPALAGLGAPWWDPDARGMIIGITQDTGPAHIVRAALESLAWQTRDLVEEMQRVTGTTMACLRVDGGACANDLLMQLQADALGIPVERPTVIESTAMGAAAIAGIGAGRWDQTFLEQQRLLDRSFAPNVQDNSTAWKRWRNAVQRSMHWAPETY